MHITYSRVTRNIWITDLQGNTVARTVAPAGQKMIDAAGEFLMQNGCVRTGDYLLVSTGSPLRRASIAPRIQRPSTPGGVSASAVARILNTQFGMGRFFVRQRGDHVLVQGPRDHTAVRLLQSRGYRVSPQTQYEVLVTGKTG